MLILGIDPGSRRIGWGLIKKRGNLKLIDSGVIDVKAKSQAEALVLIEKAVKKLIGRKKPDLAALEKLYFAKNQKTALEVAEARGVIALALAKNGVPTLEFTPTEVKSAVASNGRADKKAVAKMAAAFLGRLPKGPDDVTDALAIAITASAKTLDRGRFLDMLP